MDVFQTGRRGFGAVEQVLKHGAVAGDVLDTGGRIRERHARCIEEVRRLRDAGKRGTRAGGIGQVARNVAQPLAGLVTCLGRRVAAKADHRPLRIGEQHLDEPLSRRPRRSGNDRDPLRHA